METVTASYRFARISAFKVREVTREIQGLPVAEALAILQFTPKKAAGLVAKTLKSAIANAENNKDLRMERLTVSKAVVGEGPTIKRFIPRARGSAGPIRKRMSHIYISVTDNAPVAQPRERGKNKKAKARTSPPAAASAMTAAAPAPEATAAPAEPETTTPTTAAEQASK